MQVHGHAGSKEKSALYCTVPPLFSKHTQTVLQWMQVHGHAGSKEQSALYCAATLQRQLAAGLSPFWRVCACKHCCKWAPIKWICLPSIAANDLCAKHCCKWAPIKWIQCWWFMCVLIQLKSSPHCSRLRECDLVACRYAQAYLFVHDDTVFLVALNTHVHVCVFLCVLCKCICVCACMCVCLCVFVYVCVKGRGENCHGAVRAATLEQQNQVRLRVRCSSESGCQNSKGCVDCVVTNASN